MKYPSLASFLAVLLTLSPSSSWAELRGSSNHRREQELTASGLTGFQLINANTDVVVANLTNGTIIALDEIAGMLTPAFNINVTFVGTGIKSVLFNTNIPNHNIDRENTPPFALCGNNKTDFFNCVTLGIGNYTVTATPYSQRNQGGTAGAAITVNFAIVPSKRTAYFLPNLTYPFEGLEPYIDNATMHLHHGRHHAGAIANLNNATANTTYKVPLVNLMTDALASRPIRNNGGSHYNHAFFWAHMAPPAISNYTKPSEQLQALINSSFGSTDAMRTKFNAAAAPGTLFGSGWVWVCVNSTFNGLVIVGTPNQDNPLMKGVFPEVLYPIMGLDVWEHAHYLKYQNRRAEYVTNWWYVINWDVVSANTAYVIANKAGVPVQG